MGCGYGLLLSVTLLASLCSTYLSSSCPSDQVCEGQGASLSSHFLHPSKRVIEEIAASAHQQNDHEEVIDSHGIYISIRSTLKYHSTRLPSIFLTWMKKVSPLQVHLTTERETNGSDIWIENAIASGFHVFYSDCPTGHQRDDLCCKTGMELSYFYQTTEKYRWYCHFDDDIYVNVPALVASLSNHDPHQDRVYIGRWPLAKDHMSVPKGFSERFPIHQREIFRYATGAAYCISVALMMELEEYLRGGELLSSYCKALRLPDDMLIGCVIGAVLGYNLTNDVTFNSNLNHMKFRPDALRHQVTVSYGTWTTTRNEEKVLTQNKLAFPDARFSEDEDPTRFFSYHCLLYPDTRWCGAHITT